MNNAYHLYDMIMDKVQNDGALYPTLGESTDPDNPVVIVDNTGRVWTVEVRELK